MGKKQEIKDSDKSDLDFITEYLRNRYEDAENKLFLIEFKEKMITNEASNGLEITIKFIKLF